MRRPGKRLRQRVRWTGSSLVRHTLRALAVQTEEPREMLASLNEVLLAQGLDRFSTVVVVRLRRAAASFDGRLRAGLGAADVAELRRLLAQLTENAQPD